MSYQTFNDVGLVGPKNKSMAYFISCLSLDLFYYISKLDLLKPNSIQPPLLMGGGTCVPGGSAEPPQPTKSPHII